ncbi:hypothetical protein [Serratia nematodiphila]|uniref:hypothetical protein n=1 Tax=Serratia nematodiphila TaxID=458197 RepID=UPI0011DBBC9F|nr:hypothetical protein [Serratia nematodiphila]TXE64538.1 hypothetical protein FOT58_09320 [Serratia nematodiphila]
MPLFTCGFPPKKSAAANGTVALAIAVEAKNAKLAEMKATMLLEEAFPNSTSNFFKPKICADREGLPRPPIDQFDAEWMTKNQWNDDTKEYEPIPLPEQTEEEEEEDDESAFTAPKTIFELPVGVRVAYILMYGTEPDTVDLEHLSNAYDLINDDDAEPRLRAIVDALPRVPQVKSMLITSVEKLIEAIQAKSPAMTSWPEVKKFADSWVHTTNTDRASAPENNTAITRSYDALDNEIALAIMGVNPLHAKASDVTAAKELIKKRDQTWRAWSMSLRVIVDILYIDREIIFEMITAGLSYPEFSTDSDIRRKFIHKCLSERCGMVFDTEEKPVQNAASQVTDSLQKVPTSQDEQLKVQSLGDGKFSIDGLIGNSEKPSEPTNEPEAATDDAIVTDDFQTRASVLEKELDSKKGTAAKNLDIWKRVQRTDPARTKRKDTRDNSGKIIRTVTSIRPTYQYMRATEIFGPFGIGWGVDVLEERFDPGIPLMEGIIDSAGRETGKKVMRDSDGKILTSLNHTMKIMLWYNHDGARGEIIAYGHTKYLYASKFGLSVEEEPSKKSLTDATTKALSSLGFSADVYLGMFEDNEYTQENEYEHSIKNASDKAEDSVRLRKELDERFKANTETMRNAVTSNEVVKICSSLTRVIGSHIKSAKAVADMEHVKYLESRLTRLEEIKVECLARFEEEKK